MRPAILSVPLLFLILLYPCHQAIGMGAERFNEIEWTHSIAEAKAKAAPEDKLIIVDLYADWCGWCKQMDLHTWAHAAVIAESGSYVFLRLNAEKEKDGIQLRRRFGVTGFPTVLILDSRGDEFERLEGYLPAETFLAKLHAAIDDPSSLGNLRAVERRDPKDVNIRFQLASKLMDRNDFAGAEKRFASIVREDPSNRFETTDVALFYLALCQLNRDSGNESLATIDRVRKDFPDSPISPNAVLLSSEILMQLGRPDDAKERIQEFLKRYPGHPLAPRAKLLLSQPQ
jgi:thioredoxin-related protein